MGLRKLKASEVAQVREAIRTKRQKGICPLCDTKVAAAQATLDHDHTTGLIRGVLCRNCNGIEGKIKNLVRRAKRALSPDEWMRNLLDYHAWHKTDRTNLIHPSHKTATEKRLALNAKRRRARAKAKKKGK